MALSGAGKRLQYDRFSVPLSALGRIRSGAGGPKPRGETPSLNFAEMLAALAVRGGLPTTDQTPTNGLPTANL
jgi:hypothetical protein